MGIHFSTKDPGGGSANAFNPIQVSGRSDLLADGEEALEFVAGSNITITTSPGTTPKKITIEATGGGGEANTTSNSGGGEPLALAKAGINLPFKTITAGTGVNLTPSATELEIAASGALTAHDIDGSFHETTEDDEGAVLSGNSSVASPKSPIFIKRFLDEDLDLYIAPDGDDTTGDGTTGNPWFSPNRALEHIAGWHLVENVRIIMKDTDAGTSTFYDWLETQELKHPQGGQIKIIPENVELYEDKTIGTPVFTTDHYTVTVTLTSLEAAKFGIGDYIFVYFSDGAALEDGSDLDGFHEVTGVTATTITFQAYNRQYGPVLPYTPTNITEISFWRATALVKHSTRVHTFNIPAGFEWGGIQNIGCVMGVVANGNRCITTVSGGVLLAPDGFAVTFFGTSGFNQGIKIENAKLDFGGYVAVSKGRFISTVQLENNAKLLCTGLIVNYNQSTQVPLVRLENDSLVLSKVSNIVMGSSETGLSLDGTCKFEAIGYSQISNCNRYGAKVFGGSYLRLGSGYVSRCATAGATYYGLEVDGNATADARNVSYTNNDGSRDTNVGTIGGGVIFP